MKTSQPSVEDAHGPEQHKDALRNTETKVERDLDKAQ